jgi:TetR/AcrR family transcriptional repressor of nem operon
MKVSKAQVQENRARIVETASTLFREKGYDGVGIADLMAAAGFTHGGFYKHFPSKVDLMAEAATCGIAHTLEQASGMNIDDYIALYLSREHRDARGAGCTLAALSGDATRQSDIVRAAFEAGIEKTLTEFIGQSASSNEGHNRETRAEALSVIAHTLGAIALSRACPDGSPLADEILNACRDRILGRGR